MASRRAISAVARHLRHPPLATSAVAARRDLQHLFVRSIGCAAPKCCFPLDLFSTPSGFRSADLMPYGGVRGFSSPPEKSSDDDNEEEDEGDDEDDNEEEDEEVEEGEFEDDDGDVLGAPKRVLQSGKSEEEKRKEATEIGYQVLGPLSSSENPFKPYEPVFAVVQVGSHQFKVSNGDSIFTERLKYCEVNEKLVLNKVLMLGSKSQTVVGRPILPEASVHAVVEEHALDAKVIIFKKKRRKNYRRTKGHRQELTKLRITDIQGIVKSDVGIAA